MLGIYIYVCVCISPRSSDGGLQRDAEYEDDAACVSNSEETQWEFLHPAVYQRLPSRTRARQPACHHGNLTVCLFVCVRVCESAPRVRMKNKRAVIMLN